jgi:hypothetical protein
VVNPYSTNVEYLAFTFPHVITMEV